MFKGFQASVIQGLSVESLGVFSSLKLRRKLTSRATLCQETTSLVCHSSPSEIVEP